MSASEEQQGSTLQYWEYVIESTVSVLQSMCDATVTPCPAKSGTRSIDEDAIAAVISLVGDIEWSIWAEFPRRTAIGVARAFAGVEVPFDSDEMGDATGELLNMIGGDVKTKLSRHGLMTKLSLPGVIRGRKLCILAQSDQPSEQGRLKMRWGEMWLGVAAGLRVGEAREVGR